jgi:peptide/nickel transport system permease protein
MTAQTSRSEQITAQPGAVAGTALPAGSEGPARPVRRRRGMPQWFAVLWINRKARFGIVLLAVFIVTAVFAPLLAPFDPRDDDLPRGLGPTASHWLGTTGNGQDILSQIIYGARTSLLVGLFGGLLGTAIALLIGLTAGYSQGWVDDILSFLINLGLVIPVLPLMATLASYSPVRGTTLIVLIIGFTSWAWGARIKRAQIVTLRTRDYVTAARFAGDGTFRIIFREILPNMTSLVVAGFIATVTAAIGAEAGLTFLGLGDPNSISWGTMLFNAENNSAMLTGQWPWLFAPGIALALLITSLTLVNFGVDALSNPHLREG